MALLTKLGTIVSPATSGHYEYDSVGFRPKAIIFWMSGASVDNSFSDNYYFMFGVSGSYPTVPNYIRETSWGASGLNNIQMDNFGANLSFMNLFSIVLFGHDKFEHAHSIQYTETGFTLEWSVQVGTVPRQIHYLAIGGNDVHAATRGLLFTDFSFPDGYPEYVDLAGFGFRPQLYFAWSSPWAYNESPAYREQQTAQLTFAMGTQLTGRSLDGGFQIWNQSVPFNNAPLGLTYQHFGQAYAGTRVFPDASVEALPDGLRLRHLENIPLEHEHRILAIGGNIMGKTGAFARSVVAGATTQDIDVGFRPKVVFVVSNHAAAVLSGEGPITYSGANRLTLGASDGTDNLATSLSDTHVPVLSFSKAESYSAANAVYVKHNNSTRSVTSRATLTLPNSNGFRLNFSDNDTEATSLLYFALAEANSLTGSTSGVSRSYLREIRHLIQLRGRLIGRTRITAWLGPAHILDPDRVTGTSAAVAEMSGTALLSGRVAGTSLARAALAQTPAFSGIALGTSRATAASLRRDVFFDGRLTGYSLASAWLSTQVGLFPQRLTGYSEANGYLILRLPPILPTPPHHAPGTINLHRNPSAERDLLDWFELEDGEIERTTAEQRHGNASVKVTIPAAATGSGFYTAGAKGLALAAQEWSIYGQMMMMGAGVTGIKAYLRGYYSDGTTVDGDSVDLELSNQWEHYPIPAFVTDPDKIFIGADIVVERTDSGGELVFYVDMVQIEEGQLSSFAYGGFGPPYYSWNGPADASITARQPIPYVVGSVGEGGGVITIEGRIYRATYDNDILEDLTDHLIDATVSMDAERDYTWVFDGTMTRRGWDRLRPAHDWLAPFMRVTYPNGIVREGQLGLYMVYDSPSEFTEWSEVVDIQAFDALWLLDRQAFPGSVIAPINYNKVHFARQILEGAVLTEDKNGPRRFSIPADPDQFKGNREWDRETTRLEVVNDCLKSAGLHPLWSTRTGVLTSKPRGQKRLLNQNPVRMWHANVPEGMVLADNVRFNPNIPSEIIGTVVTEPKSLDMVNETLIISDAPEGMRALAKKRIANIRNKRDRLNRKDEERRDLTPAQRRQRRRRRIRRIGIPYLDDDAKAAQVARALLDKWSTKDEVVTFSAVPDPSREFTNECIYLGIWNGYGQEVAVGKYLVHKVSYGFTPKDGEMKVVAGRVQNSEDIYED